ncbi:MAG: ribosomal protein S12 methylthiotransferase [Parcubacteria group bacterium Gr01-1014_29]|nr:MAG: ribosomal protein S12 methylthiotransferase [Parcubacteria group bacterium Gr01-1014_29]
MEIERDFTQYIPHYPLFRNAHPSADAYDIAESEGTGAGTIEKLLARVFDRIFSYARFDRKSLYFFPDVSDIFTLQQKRMLQFLYESKAVRFPTVFFDPPFNDEPKMFNAVLDPIRLKESYFLHIAPELVETFGQFHMGHSFAHAEAISKAIGEYIERFVLLPWRTHSFICASEKDLSRKGYTFLLPRIISKFSEQQKEMHSEFRLNEELPFFWVKGRSFPGGKSILLPSQSVFWGYNQSHAQEPFLGESNTSGAAGMFTQEGAILSGLRELIHRDGFLIFWLNTIAPPRIDPSTIQNNRISSILRGLKRYRFEVEILDVTTDIGLPSFVTLLIDGSSGEKRAFIGGGASSVPEEAIEQALAEVLSIYHYWRRGGSDHFNLPTPYVPFSKENSVGHFDRVNLWASPAMFPKLRWFLNGTVYAFGDRKKNYEICAADPAHELSFLVQKFKSLGEEYAIYYFEARQKFLNTLRYRVVKTVVPALVPLYLHEHLAPLAASRLVQVPKKLGYTAIQFPNPLPHPFP